jgi:hypothetical protein
MTLIFSQRPGRNERHLRRKHNNPLFPESERSITPDELLEAQRLDHEELVEFIVGFRELVQKAVNLKNNEEADVILDIKEQLDMAYEKASGLADEQSETKEAINKLTQIIMNSIRSNAAGDRIALDELRQEQEARTTHYSLLQNPIVADLLHPESPILESDLAATLLSESPEGLEAALELFDDAQLQIICEEGTNILRNLPAEGEAFEQAKQRLTEIGTKLTEGVCGAAN